MSEPSCKRCGQLSPDCVHCGRPSVDVVTIHFGGAYTIGSVCETCIEKGVPHDADVTGTNREAWNKALAERKLNGPSGYDNGTWRSGGSWLHCGRGSR